MLKLKTPQYVIALFERIGGKVEFIPARFDRRYQPDASSLSDAIKIADDLMQRHKLEAVAVTTNHTRSYNYINIRKEYKADTIYAARLAAQDAYNKLFHARNPQPGNVPPIDLWRKNIKAAQDNLIAQEAILEKLERGSE